MKIEMKNNVVTLSSTNKKEAQKMVEFYYGLAQKPEKIIQRVVVQGPGKGKYQRRKMPKVTCPKCGREVRGLKQHDNLKHQAMSPGWSINANNKRQVRELLPN